MSTFSHESTSLVTGIILKFIQRMEDTPSYTSSVAHLQQNQITYYDHWKKVSWSSLLLLRSAMYLFIHSLVPALCNNNENEKCECCYDKKLE